jgi:hypothetical protein
MEKLNGVLRISALLLVFVLVGFAGCASTGGTDGPNAAAKRLVADINAIEAGKATVSGDTVTLTGGIRLENAALAVPAGVTLDLTADGAVLELQDGAVLTVNGTVNATGHGDHGKGWVEGSLRTYGDTATINGSGTISLKSNGRLLNIGSDRGHRQLTLDGVTLVGLPDNDNPLVGIGENGAFTMKSGAITGNTYNRDDWASGGGVDVWHGTFTMESGAISGNGTVGGRGSNGGGVSVGEGSVFTMSGGEISGNAVGYSGGGVYIRKGTFIMKGGEISGNTVKGKLSSGYGSDQVHNDEGAFILEGSTPSGVSIIGLWYFSQTAADVGDKNLLAWEYNADGTVITHNVTGRWPGRYSISGKNIINNQFGNKPPEIGTYSIIETSKGILLYLDMYMRSGPFYRKLGD